MLVRTVLVYHQGLPLGWIDVHVDGSIEYEYDGIERLVKNVAAYDRVEADAVYAWNLRYRLGGPYVVTWLSPENLEMIGRSEPT